MPQIVLTSVDTSAYRGGSLHFTGQISASGRPLANRLVDVFLAPAGHAGLDAIPLGRTTSTADGTFVGDAAIPATVDLARYQVYASSPEDDDHNGAISR